MSEKKDIDKIFTQTEITDCNRHNQREYLIFSQRRDDDVKPRCHIVNNPRDNNSLWGNHSAKKYIIIFISKWAHCNHLIHPFIHPSIHPIDIIIAILTFQYMSKGLNQHPTLSSTLTFPFSSSSSSFR